MGGLNADVNSPIDVPRAHRKLLAKLNQVAPQSGLEWYFSIGPSFNMENWFSKKDEIKSGVVTGSAGDGKIAFVAVADIGAAAAYALQHPTKHNGKHINLAGEIATEEYFLNAISEATGLPVKYNNIPPGVQSFVD